MALRRFRVVRYPDFYAVIDHGEPQGVMRLDAAPGSDFVGAGETVPRYVQDGAPEDPRSGTFVVWRSRDLTPESKRSAQAEANARNAAWEDESDAHDAVRSDMDYQLVEEG